MQVYDSVTELIGKTPLIALKGFGENLYGKCEFLNPSHSIKDRAAYAMIKERLIVVKSTKTLRSSNARVAIWVFP